MHDQKPEQKCEPARLPLSSLSSLFQHFGEAVCSIAVLRWIAPAEMGIWQAALLLYAGITVFRLGVVNAMARDYPFHLGESDLPASEAVRDVAWTYSVLLSVLIGIAFLVSSLVVYILGDDMWSKALAVLATYTVANTLIPVYESVVRGSRDFGRLGRIQIISTLLSFATLPIVARSGFDGFCLRIVVLSGIQIAIYSWGGGGSFSLRWDWGRFRHLMRSGIPLHISNYLGLLSTSVPRIVVLIFGDLALLGLFAPVGSILSFGQAACGRVKAYCYPQLSYMYGRGMSARDISRSAVRMSIGIFVIMLVVACIVYPVLPLLLVEYSPAYYASLLPMQIGLFVSLAAAIEFVLMPLVIMKQHRLLLISSILQPPILFSVCAMVALFSPDSQLTGIVWGLLTGRLLWLAISAYLVFWRASIARS
ncbi:lipopolysaccharide biosynthesis protein [Rhodocyclus tenuis]|uniref:O-antigen/teichoic acid export membrane protein n=1 Tax=Rhodocyclus tenuis TaxID=1066 RepID=A0A840FW37_RHOTE|nr:oligosaccharide flippase family protein [Rhodocyclus tenuis]MBB4246307.1 O-antigen/teichoic acid export membrane protein [Rhodocyclus tenuis]